MVGLSLRWGKAMCGHLPYLFARRYIMENKRKSWMGVIGALGVAVFLLGLLGGLYSVGMAMALAVSIWVVGATLVIALTQPPGDR